MKILSRITAILLSIIMISAMTAAQILYCLHSTAMSPQHVARVLENDEKLNELTNAIYDSFAVSKKNAEQEMFLKQYTLKILSNADPAWVKSQIYITAKGLHQYIFSDISALPTLDIIPLKKTISDVLISDIIKSEQGMQRTEKIKAILSSLNNRYFAKIITLGLNNQLVSMLLELSPIRSTGFDKSTINEIIRIYISLNNKNISLDQASISIAEQMTFDMLRLNEIKDYFDLNIFIDKAFGELDPLKACKTFISGIDKTTARTINITLLSTFLLVTFFKRFRFIDTARTLALCLLISDLILLPASALIINKHFIERLLSNLYDIQSTFSYVAASYASLLIRDFGLYLALQASLIGLLCAVVVFIASKFKAQIKNKKPARLFLRIKLSLGILAIIFVVIILGFISLSNQYDTFNNKMVKLSQTDIPQAVKKGLIEAGGMEFINLIEKEK